MAHYTFEIFKYKWITDKEFDCKENYFIPISFDVLR